MKAINIKKNSISIALGKFIDLSDRQPCWYANFDKENAKWIIGVKKTGGPKVEHSFPATKDSNSSPDFAVELIEVFRANGEDGIKELMKGK